MKEAPSLPWWFSDARKWFGLSVLTSFRTLGEVRERKSVTWYSLTACVLRERRQRGREGWVRKDTNRAKWGLTCWKSLIENFKLQPLSELGEMNSCWMSNEKLKKKKAVSINSESWLGFTRMNNFYVFKRDLLPLEILCQLSKCRVGKFSLY